MHECKKAPLINTKFLLRNDGLDRRPLLASRPKFVGRENHSRARPTAPRAPSRADVPLATFLHKIHKSNLDVPISSLRERQKNHQMT